MKVYHSALKSDLSLNKEMDFFKSSDGSVVFKHDILDGYHRLFDGADVIYSEPAWRHGFEKFMQRAGAKGDFNTYLAAIQGTITELGLPAYVVMGIQMKHRLAPDYSVPIKLHGYKCLLGVWNEPITKTIMADVITNYDAIDRIVKKHETVLDFCCGYGNTALAAKTHNKKSICSDVNGKCIYYVATEVMGHGTDHLF